jgi:MoaA/NifB/PqqE/SkfB family radical SAM enzyme
MALLTIETKGEGALKELQNLEQQDLMRIVKEPDSNLYALPGEPISNEDFTNWIEYANNSPTISLIEAKQRWEDQKRILRKHTF